mmetsp:Transcript_62006/g.196015  ORF Transcript_62006/g.196015 Transcript_62006/m.196015 type:complete len:916 (-) Transcript_62006:1610-4357(-)
MGRGWAARGTCLLRLLLVAAGVFPSAASEPTVVHIAADSFHPHLSSHHTRPAGLASAARLKANLSLGLGEGGVLGSGEALIHGNYWSVAGYPVGSSRAWVLRCASCTPAHAGGVGSKPQRAPALQVRKKDRAEELRRLLEPRKTVFAFAQVAVYSQGHVIGHGALNHVHRFSLLQHYHRIEMDIPARDDTDLLLDPLVVELALEVFLPQEEGGHFQPLEVHFHAGWRAHVGMHMRFAEPQLSPLQSRSNSLRVLAHLEVDTLGFLASWVARWRGRARGDLILFERLRGSLDSLARRSIGAHAGSPAERQLGGEGGLGLVAGSIIDVVVSPASQPLCGLGDIASPPTCSGLLAFNYTPGRQPFPLEGCDIPGAAFTLEVEAAASVGGLNYGHGILLRRESGPEAGPALPAFDTQLLLMHDGATAASATSASRGEARAWACGTLPPYDDGEAGGAHGKPRASRGVRLPLPEPRPSQGAFLQLSISASRAVTIYCVEVSGGRESASTAWETSFPPGTTVHEAALAAASHAGWCGSESSLPCAGWLEANGRGVQQIQAWWMGAPLNPWPVWGPIQQPHSAELLKHHTIATLGIGSTAGGGGGGAALVVSRWTGAPRAEAWRKAGAGAWEALSSADLWSDGFAAWDPELASLEEPPPLQRPRVHTRDVLRSWGLLPSNPGPPAGMLTEWARGRINAMGWVSKWLCRAVLGWPLIYACWRAMAGRKEPQVPRGGLGVATKRGQPAGVRRRRRDGGVSGQLGTACGGRSSDRGRGDDSATIGWRLKDLGSVIKGLAHALRSLISGQAQPSAPDPSRGGGARGHSRGHQPAPAAPQATSGIHALPPRWFLCPITQDVMLEPVFAGDGFTYEGEAIRKWLKGHDTSPMTNVPLAQKTLVPNHTLRAAIREWVEAGGSVDSDCRF